MDWPTIEHEPTRYEDRLREAKEYRLAKRVAEASQDAPKRNPIMAFLRSLIGQDVARVDSGSRAEARAR